MTGASDAELERKSAVVAAAGLTLLMLVGLLVRLHGLDQTLVTFHPTRHYRSAVLARACYYDATPAVPAWARHLADANRDMQPSGEPPVMEWLACQSYRLLGHEDIRIPRSLAAICWVLGAIPLYGLGRRLSSIPFSLVGAALYLFMPYAIVATRSFQPDPLMTLCTLCAALAVTRYFEQPRSARLAAAASLIAVAGLVKPMSVFLTFAAVVGLAAGRAPWRRLLTDRRLVWLLVLGFAPGILYYGYGALFGSLARDQMRMRFVPALLPTAFFWHGWLTQIRRVFGLPLLLGSLAGIALAPRRESRFFLAALWLGYAAFAVAFTYHMPTHDYYHLPYVAVVALGVAATLERLLEPVARRADPRVLLGAAGLAAASIALWGSAQAWPRLTTPRADETVARYERIGELTHHDERVLFLDLEYGYSLMYHGQLSGDSWPNADDLAAEALDGEPPIGARERFARDFAGFRPTYFVVTDLRSLEAEPDLRQLLAERTAVVEETATYRVYRFLAP
jgi:4-amino-4-deoxy-L-arabinose transferase-like glycosyltransferase